MSVTELKFPNLGLGYYAITIFFLLVLLYKGREGSKEREKYERILFTTLLSIFLFLLICIMITDIDLLKDAVFYKTGFPKFIKPFFDFIAVYRNLLVVIIVLVFLISIIIYLFIVFYQKKEYKYSHKIFFGVLILSIILELFDFGSHYAKKNIRNMMNSLFTKEFNLAVKNTKKYKYLIAVNREHMPPYTSGTKKELLDFATYHNLESNIGLYARNNKKNNVLYLDKENDDFMYEEVDNAIYVFEKPCFVDCLKYDLTYYAIKNYIIGVKTKFEEMSVLDDDIENKTKEQRETPININLKPIENINAYVKNNSKHNYKYEAIPRLNDNKTHGMAYRECTYCGIKDVILDAAVESGHIYTDYVDDENGAVGFHGTKTATCICGKTDTKPSQNDVLGHEYSMSIVQYPRNDAPCIRMLKCKTCDKTIEGSEQCMNIDIEYDEVIYDGEAHEPALTIKDAEGNVIDRENCNIKYQSNTQVGEAKISVSFKDDNEGLYFPFNVFFYILPTEPVIKHAEREDADTLKVDFYKTTSRFDGYEIEYSNTAKFDEEDVGKYITNRKSNDSIKIDEVDMDKHFVRMRAYKTVNGERDKIYSKWSNFERFD